MVIVTFYFSRKGELEINFLFWNINKKNLSPYLIDACLENNIDILILSEHKGIDINHFISRLNSKGRAFQEEQVITNSRLLLLHNANIKVLILNENKYYSVYKVTNENGDFLVFAVHFPSLNNLESSVINTLSSKISREFECFEKDSNLESSIVVGDFNMNPFADGITSGLCFNAVMCPDVASKIKRTVLYEERKYYYNPMWHIMGNHDNSIKGSYYYSSTPDSLYWYTFDQVLIRPSLVPRFDINKLRIINRIGDNNLLNKKNIPNKEVFSDHLPLIFNIE